MVLACMWLITRYIIVIVVSMYVPIVSLYQKEQFESGSITIGIRGPRLVTPPPTPCKYKHSVIILRNNSVIIAIVLLLWPA